MPKVAFFLPSLEGGGAERVCVTLAGAFLHQGLAVDFVLGKKTGQLLDDIPAGAGLIDLASRRTLTALLPLAAYLRKENPFALIAAPDHANLVAIWAKLLASSQTRVLISCHNQMSIAIQNSRKIQEKKYPLLLHLFYRQADALVAVSQGVADDLACVARIPREKIKSIYNPFPVDEIVCLGSQLPSHPWFGLGKTPVVLAVGRLTAQKDHSTLLRAYAALRSRRPVRLVILGEGEERARLLALADELGIRSDVDLPGFTDNPYSYMTHCRVLVLSSIWEGFGNVLVEALACGTQVVSTDCPSGPAEILENGTYGRLVPVGDVKAMAKAIESALDDPLPVEKLHPHAQAFSTDVAAKQYLDALGLA
jgi:glycosyltransferase involved in cell wall biosynthesis